MSRRYDILTLFPEMCASVLTTSIPGRAANKGLAEYHYHNPRDHGLGNYRKVDDRPFGGGPGMLMMAPVLAATLDHAERQDERPAKRLMTSPRGVPLTQRRVRELAGEPRLLIVTGHYEGVDERFAEEYEVEEFSVGDFVLSGGELPALCLIDAVVRTLPGVLGHDDGADEETFEDEGVGGLLEHPQYTRPREWRGRAVPDVLLSGDHAKVAAWQAEQRRRVTAERRPDLLENLPG